MSAIPYRNLNSQASFCQPIKSISVECNRPTNASPDVSRRNLRRATWHVLESKRLVLAESQHTLHRGTWLTLTTVAEVCSRLLIALDRLAQLRNEENDGE